MHCYDSRIILCRRQLLDSVSCVKMIERKQQHQKVKRLPFELAETCHCRRRQNFSHRTNSAIINFESDKKRNLFIVLTCILININYVAPNRYSNNYEKNLPVQQQQQPPWSLLYYPHKCHHPTVEHYRQFHGTIESLQLQPQPQPEPHQHRYHDEQQPNLNQYQQPPPAQNQQHFLPQLVQLRSPTFHEPTNLMIRENELNLLNRQQLTQLRQQQTQQQQQQRKQLRQNNQFLQQRQNGFDLIDEQIIVQHPPQTLITTKTTTTTTETETETETNEQSNEQRRQQQQQNLLLQRQNIVAADIDECLDERACGRGASCENLLGSFRCSCPPGFTGDPTVECIGK